MNNKALLATTAVLVTFMLVPVACVDRDAKAPVGKKWSAEVATSYCGCGETEDAQDDDPVTVTNYPASCDEFSCGMQDNGAGGVDCGPCRGHEQVCINGDGGGRNGYCAIAYQTADSEGLSGPDGSPCGGPQMFACVQAADPNDPDQSPVYFCLAENLNVYNDPSASAPYCDYLEPSIGIGDSGCSYNSDCSGEGVCVNGVCQ
jgi:hypothetical protein